MHESIWHILSGGKNGCTNCIYKIALSSFLCFELGGHKKEYSLGELFSKNKGKIRDERIVKI